MPIPCGVQALLAGTCLVLARADAQSVATANGAQVATCSTSAEALRSVGACHLQHTGAALRSSSAISAGDAGGHGDGFIDLFLEGLVASIASPPEEDAETWKIIGAEGVKYSDIARCEHGACYFLAAIASMAYFHPEVIEAMFVRRHLWMAASSETRPVYTTQWLLNGKNASVAVDDLVPVDPDTGQPVFAGVRDGAGLWPIVLEKAWAKIFGAFKLVDGGTVAEAFKALGPAPIDIHRHSEDIDKALLWSYLENSTSERFPTCAESRDNAVNIPSRMAFAVLNVSEIKGHGKVVNLYGPWAEDFFQATIPSKNPDDGILSMTIDEYFASFETTTIARISNWYVASSKVLSTEAQNTVVAIEFEIQGSDPFSVHTEWPNPRFLPGCMIVQPRVTTAVAKKDDLTRKVLSKQRFGELPGSRADMDGSSGPGTYIAFVAAAYPNGPWMEEITLTVYAATPVKIQPSEVDPVDLFLEMHGMCDIIQVRGLGTFEKRADEIVGGLPSFWQRKRGNTSASGFMHKVIYWDPEMHEEYMGKHIVSGERKWKLALSVSSARSRISYNESFDAKTDISCAEEFLSNRSTKPASKEEEDEMSEEVQASQNLMHGLALTSIGRGESAGPQESCKQSIERLYHLDNTEDIANGTDDSLFPAAESSIGTVTDACGESATIAFVPCLKYNQWKTFKQIAVTPKIVKETLRTNISKREALMEKCISGTPMTQMCLVKNSCAHSVEVVCDSESGIAGRKTSAHHRLDLPAKGSGFADLLFCRCAKREKGDGSGRAEVSNTE